MKGWSKLLEKEKAFWPPRNVCWRDPATCHAAHAILLTALNMTLPCELLWSEDWLRGIDNTASDSEDSAKALVTRNSATFKKSAGQEEESCGQGKTGGEEADGEDQEKVFRLVQRSVSDPTGMFSSYVYL